MSIISGSPELNGNPLVEQQARLKLKRALLAEQARRTAAGLGIAPTYKEVSGHVVAPSIGEHLAKLAQKGVEVYNQRAGEKEAAAEEGSLRGQIEAAAEQALAKGRDQIVPFQAPGIDEADAAAASQGTRTMQKGDRVGAGRALSQLPGYEALGQNLMSDELINAPVRAEAKAEKRADREDRQAQAAAEAEARRAARKEEIEARLADAKLAREERAALSRELLQLTAANRKPERDRFQLITGDDGTVSRVNLDTGEATPVGKLGKSAASTAAKLPAALQRAYVENSVSMQKIDDTLKAIEANPNAVGLKTIIPDVALQRIDPKGVSARAQIADVGSLKIHDRSGAAVTAAEMPRLKPFIPNQSDNAETVKTKLRNFRREYEIVQREIEAQGAPARSAGGAGGSWSAPQGGEVARPTSKAERDALPPGTRYIGPDGRTAVR